VTCDNIELSYSCISTQEHSYEHVHTCTRRVVAMNVLEHTEDLQRLLQEVQRVLKPGGVFAFHTINRSWCVCVCV